MVKCSFCGGKLIPGTGKMFVSKSGIIKYFCSRKCEKHWKMGKDPRKTKWTDFFMEKK